VVLRWHKRLALSAGAGQTCVCTSTNVGPLVMVGGGGRERGGLCPLQPPHVLTETHLQLVRPLQRPCSLPIWLGPPSPWQGEHPASRCPLGQLPLQQPPPQLLLRTFLRVDSGGLHISFRTKRFRDSRVQAGYRTVPGACQKQPNIMAAAGGRADSGVYMAAWEKLSEKAAEHRGGGGGGGYLNRIEDVAPSRVACRPRQRSNRAPAVAVRGDRFVDVIRPPAAPYYVLREHRDVRAIRGGPFGVRRK
jgi:hypothetical protein